MALTDATRLADFSSGVGTDGTLSANHINATGVVTATSFVGSGSGLTGVASTDNIITGTAATFTAGINVTGAAVTISNAGVHVTGVVTATSFEGDGSALTGVISGVELEFGGNSVGTAVTNINFSGVGSVTAPVAGLSTVTINKQLTIGVRVGSAVTFNLVGQTFNVINRAGGNVAIDV